jgi:hypothetical protein
MEIRSTRAPALVARSTSEKPTPNYSRPKEVHATFDEEGAGALRELLHRVSAQQTLS